mmetsp:Transcript_20415/g.19397  ORF Transcript_20415/g.19397 Transcript_20415/m.19397 type:complete len:147 (+) Transcript_20415:11-451(+)
MGCCSSSKGGGSKIETVDNLEFKHMNMREVDDFFDKVKTFMDSFKEATAPYEDAKTEFFDVTKFYEVPGAKVTHMVKGTVYGMISMSNGDISKLNLGLTFENPFVTVANDAFAGDLAPYGKELTEAMVKLMKAMKEMVMDNLPDLV